MTLELKGVSYRYAGSTRMALADIDLTVDTGTVVGVMGAGEAGKSTLCLVAAGLAPGTIGGHLVGSVTVDGIATVGARPFELAQRCGIVFQNPATQLSATSPTVWEEIAFGPRNLSLPLSEVIARTETAAATLGINDLLPRDPSRLSGGQAQLVALAAVIAMRPAHLILDEPTAQLDPAGTRLVADAVAALAAAGTAILITEQKPDLIERISQRVVVLDAGRIVLDGDAKAILRDPHLPELGVAEPSDVRLRRLATEAGLDPARLTVVQP